MLAFGGMGYQRKGLASIFTSVSFVSVKNSGGSDELRRLFPWQPT